VSWRRMLAGHQKYQLDASTTLRVYAMSGVDGYGAKRSRYYRRLLPSGYQWRAPFKGLGKGAISGPGHQIWPGMGDQRASATSAPS
jgi:hypothetical protein